MLRLAVQPPERVGQPPAVGILDPVPLQVLINTGPHQHWPVLNLDEDELKRRFVEPWLRGEPVVARGRHFNVSEYWLSVYESPGEVVLNPDPVKTAVDIRFNFKEVTDDHITEPFGAHIPAPRAAANFAADRRAVMVVHGRNASARRAIFEFLRSLDLRPLEWTELVGSVNMGAPYIGEVLDAAFSKAQAVIVLFTPDDVARLGPSLVPDGGPESEATPKGQARPNVFLEAGMALGRFPSRTILVELGTMRAASDLLGRHAVRLNAGAECRKDLAQRLEGAGCEVNTDGTDWLGAGDFVPPAAAEEEGADMAGGAAATSAASGLVRRIEVLRSDLGDERGFPRWGIAELYNRLLEEAAADDLPKAQPDTRRLEQGEAPRRSRMGADEMRSHLGQLRERLL